MTPSTIYVRVLLSVSEMMRPHTIDSEHPQSKVACEWFYMGWSIVDSKIKNKKNEGLKAATSWPKGNRENK